MPVFDAGRFVFHDYGIVYVNFSRRVIPYIVQSYIGATIFNSEYLAG